MDEETGLIRNRRSLSHLGPIFVGMFGLLVCGILFIAHNEYHAMRWGKYGQGSPVPTKTGNIMLTIFSAIWFSVFVAGIFCCLCRKPDE